MKKLLQIVLVSSLSLLCFSCYYDNETIEIPDVSDEVFFSSDVQPILTKCIGCHNGTTSPDLREGNSYDALIDEYVTPGDANNSDLYNYLPGPGSGHHSVNVTLNIEEISLIKAWIDQGAKNN